MSAQSADDGGLGRQDPAPARPTHGESATSVRPYAEYQHTPLWKALAGIVRDLETSGEISVATAPEYVIGYLCRELAAKRLVDAPALGRPESAADGER